MRIVVSVLALAICMGLISPKARAEQPVAVSPAPPPASLQPSGPTNIKTVTIDGIEYTASAAPTGDGHPTDSRPYPSCGDVQDCFNQADAALAQPGASPEVIDRATDQLSFACMNGMDFACRRAEHIFYPDGVFVSHAIDGATARDTAACNQGVAGSCLTAAWLFAFEAAIFKRADLRNTKHLGDAPAGQTQFSASIARVSNDFHQTAALSQKACDSGLKLACALYIANELAGNGPNRRANELVPDYVKLCGQGVGMACVNLAALQTKIGLPFLDFAQAKATLETFCSRGSGPACYDLGDIYLHGWGIAADPAKVLDADLKGCNLGEGAACNRAGVFYIDGKGIAKALEQGLTLIKRGCDDEDPGACLNLGLAYDQGKVVAKDGDQARKYYQRACELGSSYRCNA